MMQYLKRTHSDQFYLTTAIIERAGLNDMFEARLSAPQYYVHSSTKYAIAAGSMMQMEYAKTPIKDAKGNIVAFDLKDVQNIPRTYAVHYPLLHLR